MAIQKKKSNMVWAQDYTIDINTSVTCSTLADLFHRHMHGIQLWCVAAYCGKWYFYILVIKFAASKSFLFSSEGLAAVLVALTCHPSRQ